MSITVCVYHSNILNVWPLIKDFPVGLEFQGYGFTGSQHPDQWAAINDLYIKFVQSNKVTPRALHGPFIHMLYHSPDYLIQKAVRERVNQSFEICEKLEVDIFVQHFNTDKYFTAFQSEKDLHQWISAFVNFWSSEIERFKRAGIQIVMENVHDFSPVYLRDALDSLGSSNIGFCLDVGHVNCFGKGDPIEWIKVMGPRLKHLHLHQNDGSADQHKPLTEGPINIQGVVETALEYSVNPNFSVEVEADPASIAASAEWLCNIVK